MPHINKKIKFVITFLIFVFTFFIIQSARAAYLTGSQGLWELGVDSIYHDNHNVGIGISSPAARLQINPTASNEGLRIIASDFSPFVIRNSADSEDLFRIDESGNIYSMGAIGASDYWQLNGSNLFASSTSWNVGIGTTNPSEKLHVSSGNIIFDNGYNLRSKTSTGTVSNVFGTTANQLLFGSGNWDSIRFDVGGAAGRMYINSSGNVGIGNTSPGHKLDIKGTTNVGISVSSSDNADNPYIQLAGDSGIATEGMKIYYNDSQPNTFFDSMFNNDNYGFRFRTKVSGTPVDALTIIGSGNIGIGSTNPASKLTVTGAINSNSTVNGVSLCIDGNCIVDWSDLYYSDDTRWSLWGNSISVGDFLGTGNDMPLIFKTNNVDRGRFTNDGNFVIGSSVTGTRLHVETTQAPVAFFKSTINGGNFSGYIGNGETFSGEEFGLYYAINDIRLATYNVTNGVSIYGGSGTADTGIAINSVANVGIGTTTPTAKLHVAGNANITSSLTMGGDIIMSGNNISGLNKITVNTIDPLYNIKGVNYSTFAAAIVGGVKEEYIGTIKVLDKKLDGTYEKIINFDTVFEGSDLWVWYKTVDFSSKNVQVLITPINDFAQAYYKIDGNKLVFKTDKPIELSYRLIGRRIDWRKWPTRAIDQEEKAGFYLD
jgi:hypothetical protein